jgi:hypothetical protein
MGRVPAPQLSPVVPRNSLTEGLQLVPSQEKQKGRTQSGGTARYREPVSFEANDVEMYSVLSAASPATALRLLTDGVRSAEEAVARLSAEGADNEVEDNTGIAHEMLSRRVPAEFFIMGMQRLSEEQVSTATPELLADYLEFFSIRSIMRKDSPKIADEVLSGEISLADVRKVGIDNLKTGDRLELARPAFKELQRGTAKFTVRDLTSLLERGRTSPVEMRLQREYLLRYGNESLKALSVLGVSHHFSRHSLVTLGANLYPDAKEIPDEALAVIEYTERLVRTSGLTVDDRIRDVLNKGKLLYDNGVDVEYAAERIHDEDPQVIAATFNGTHRAVSSGWL